MIITTRELGEVRARYDEIECHDPLTAHSDSTSDNREVLGIMKNLRNYKPTLNAKSIDTSFYLYQGILAVRKNILQHCVNQSDYIMTASLDGKDHLFTDYLISTQFRWSNLK